MDIGQYYIVPGSTKFVIRFSIKKSILNKRSFCSWLILRASPAISRSCARTFLIFRKRREIRASLAPPTTGGWRARVVELAGVLVNVLSWGFARACLRCRKAAAFSGQESGGLHGQLWPTQKTQNLQGPISFHCGLQTSLPTSLHGLHLSCKESEGLQKYKLLMRSDLSYSNPLLVWCSICSITDPRLWTGGLKSNAASNRSPGHRLNVSTLILVGCLIDICGGTFSAPGLTGTDLNVKRE